MNPETWQRLKPLFQAARDLSPAERSAFLATKCNGDDELRAKVEKLLAAHDAPGDFLVSPALVGAADLLIERTDAEVRAGQRIGAYEIVREIGRGGMGIVFSAVRADDQYRKQVAIKLIKRGMDTDLVLRRFTTERQILANLEHPNIARLLEGGSTLAGLPYFVMEYIEGQPIIEYCNSREFNNKERLELFRQVCSALQYAHQNLVVHRDIKPSNILVTDEGVPKLLDFGIAKLLGPGWEAGATDATASMLRLMTPEYASPEQLRGQSITTGSDVYSLGIVLYELLSGRHPYRLASRQPAEVADVILNVEPEKPSSAASRPEAKETKVTQDEQRSTDNKPIARTNSKFEIVNPKSLRGDLDNIVLKALRKEPERRYASVQEFSEDIRRHLEGLTVTASPDTWAYRANKFVHRHRAGVLASAMVLLLLVAGITATTWQARRANLERDRAQRRLDETRRFSRYLMTDVFDALAPISGTSEVTKDLTKNTLRYLDTLAQEETDDVVLLGELAFAYIKLGDVQGQFHDNRGALQSFQKAVELQRKRISWAPSDAAIKRDLIGALAKTSEILLAWGQTEEHLQVRSEIRKLLQEILDAEPNSVEDIFRLAGFYQERGELLAKLKRNEEARSDYQNALRLTTHAIALSKNSAQTPEDKIKLSFKYIYQGDVYAHLEDWPNAVASHRQAGEIAGAVWRDNPDLKQALRNTSSAHRYLAAALEKVGDYQGALENYQYSLQVLTEAEARNPALREFRRPIAIYTIKVGTAFHRVGETKRGIELVKRGLNLYRTVIAEEKYNAPVISYSFEAFQPAAEFFTAIGQPEEASAVYREWVLNFEKLRETAPGEPDLVWGSAGLYGKLGDIASAYNPETRTMAAVNRAKLEEARSWYQKSLDTVAEYRGLRGDRAEIQDFVNSTEEKLAQAKRQISR